MSSPVSRARALAVLRVKGRQVRRLEDVVGEARHELHERMAVAREAGATDVAIAQAAGVTKGRVGQLLGSKRSKG